MRPLLVLPLLLVLSACSAVPVARVDPVLPPAQRVDADDTLEVAVAAQPGVVITDDERARMAQTVRERVLRLAKDTLPDGQARAYRLAITVDRYDHGNAFRRSVRAGMGAMYIDAQVEVSLVGGEVLATFPVNRVYDWGGSMGGQATIADLEVLTGDRIGRLIVSQVQPEPVRSLRNQ